MRKKAVQQGRSEFHGAKQHERHACARRRVGEAAVSSRQIVTVLPASLSLPRQALCPWP
ncbi:MAG: hypothetical protein OJF47_001370 [Nitrospira sp.]|nr:MAG: hypothetical protein OJF47_001370 [Nitrospira sp.]